jgi:outer membrane protein insertion porin family
VYKVVERPSDQLELSAGWGGFGRSSIIGTLGVTFNNFSLRNIFNRAAWHPLPQGDGQKLSIRAQTNGEFYQSYNFSFTEPWLGGNKPTSFTLGGVITSINNEFYQGGRLKISRAFVGIGTRLRWPDDNFVFNATANLENILLNNYTSSGFVDKNGNLIRFGSYNNFYLQLSLTRTTINEPIFPRSGSRIGLTLQLTPPYTALGRTIDNFDDPQDLYRWVEYHKWRLDAEWYASLGPKFVVKASSKMGFLGFYNPEIGISPFEKFELGGDGISNQQFGITGKDIISLRGYEVGNFSANVRGGAAVFNKITMELRYPITLAPSSTIYVLGFLEAGNNWVSGDKYNPFDLKRSAGMGVRVFLPMFGLLGFDYGWGWDKPLLIAVDAPGKDFGRFSVILGFEPD